MDDTLCPACKSENAEDARYCDQCGQPLAGAAKAASGDGSETDMDAGCPACGGEVEEHADGSGRCRACGLELAAGSDDEEGGTGELAQVLSAAIMAKVRAGVPLEEAVADACRKVLPPSDAGEEKSESGAADAPERTSLGRACPVCGADCQAGEERCPECGVWFTAKHRPGQCPRCGENAAGEKCACGAFLTVHVIAKFMEPSVCYLCGTCKQPFVSHHEKCPDCGGALISADRMRASL